MMATTRRHFILTAIAFPLVASAASPSPIEVDVSNVKDVPSLIAAIRRAGGNLLPKSLPDKEFYIAFAKVFVANARAAADHGFQIPEWVLERLPKRKVIFPVLGIAIFTIYGITFAVPVATIMAAVLASFAIMVTAVVAALHAAVSTATKT